MLGGWWGSRPPGTDCGTQGSAPKVIQVRRLESHGAVPPGVHERDNYFRFLDRETRDTVLATHSMGEFQFQFRITFYQVLILEF